MSAIRKPFNFLKWIEDNKDLLKPPVGNKCLYTESGDFIIMVVGGPNARKDYHYNETEEFFYQIKGDIVVRIQEDGKAVDVPIKEGEVFLLPAKVPHSPQRKENTVGLVIEYPRKKKMKDALEWYCENCGNLLFRKKFKLENIETDMPIIFESYYSDKEKCTCDNCGIVMEAPNKIK